jgi:hypothetical protein
MLQVVLCFVLWDFDKGFFGMGFVFEVIFDFTGDEPTNEKIERFIWIQEDMKMKIEYEYIPLNRSQLTFG